jgi:hypothetical protein
MHVKKCGHQLSSISGTVRSGLVLFDADIRSRLQDQSDWQIGALRQKVTAR